jgi:subtilisin family serine protease
VLAVGAYRAAYQVGGNWQGGEIGNFSVKGPTLDGRLKPDITAPGVHVVSCVSSYTTESVTPVAVLVFQGRGYMFASWEGTSMSSPVGAGVAALLLEAFPYATPAQVRSAIMENARTDAFTGPIAPSGSTLWGMGKINAYQAVTALMPFAGVADIEDFATRIWPNPADEVLHVTLEGALDHAQFAVLDLTGRLVSEGNVNRASPTIDVRSLAPGTYLLRITNGNEHTAHRFVKR